MSEQNPATAPSESNRRRRLGVIVSIAVHAVLLTLLIVVPYQLWYQPTGDATSGGSSSQRDNQSRSQAKVTSPEEVTPEKVQAKLDAVMQEADKLSDDEKLSRLEGAAEQLTELATEESVSDVTSSLKDWLGTPERATKPSDKPVVGAFDADTAQYHDVKRTKDRNGNWRYTAVLIDAKGRTLETAMTSPTERAEAEKVYQTMQVLKSNPLADKVYRDIGMGQIDQLIGAFGKIQEAGQKVQAEQERKKAQAEAAAKEQATPEESAEDSSPR